jgi:hypothetical protein
MTDMLHNKRRKSKGEKRVDFKDLHARNAASDGKQSLVIYHLTFLIYHLVLAGAYL